MRNRFLSRFIGAFLALTLLFSITIPAAAVVPTAPAWPSIYADSAIVIDYDTGETLYTKNADSQMVPASMTKVMTAYIIFEELEAGNITLDTMVPISAKNAQISRDGTNYPASVPLPAGSSVSVDMLLKLILLPSASASCIVMAEYISGSETAFVQRMNETAARLGMDAHYQNCHGAHVHYLTARSQATLVRAFIQRFPQVLEYTSLTSVNFNGRTYRNTNYLLPGSQYAYEGADGFKTGTIAAAGYCLCATAQRDGHRIISVVMHSNNDRTRHTDSQAILDYGFQVLAQRSVFPDISYHWARDTVEELYAQGVELHTKEGENFRPNEAITRAEFTAMLYSALEKQGFAPTGEEETDVEEENIPAVRFYDIAGHWAEDYIIKAAELGIVNGVEEGIFSPDAPITREAMMVLIDRFLDLPNENGLGFADDGDISVWALEAVARVTAAGIFSGNDNNQLNPANSASRAEAATVTQRIVEMDHLF